MIKDIFKNKYEIIIKEKCIHIKYYTKVIDINTNKIELYLDNRILKIKGNSLIVCAMNEYEIVIKGIIKCIEFNNE